MRLPLFLLAAALVSSSVGADSFECLHCRQQAIPEPMKIVPGRKYARDRRADILHVKLDVTPDFAKRTISGTMTMRLKPIAFPLAKLELDAVDLDISNVECLGAVLAEREITAEKLVITFAEPIVPDAEATLTIHYSAQPQEGLYFRTPEMGYKKGDTQVWSQGEAEMHRYWFPSYDYPNERFTSEVICHAPKDMEVVSNGSLKSKTPEAGDLVAWHWLQDKPHVNYLIALACGHFHKLEDKAGALPLAMLVPPSHKAQAANAFADTGKIIEFYQKEIGIPFAWDKYYQVYCLDFLFGGMENTSCTFEAAGMLFNADTEDLRTLHRLDAHETAHQWFGDLVTCRDWAHLWLNEGFASYYTVLYEEQKSGKDAFLWSLWQEADEVLQSTDTRPIVWRDYGDPIQQFDTRAYPKGAWVLHMLRSQLGADLFRRCIKTYLERHRNGIVGTDDLQDVIEELSGLSFDQFFDQWLYHGGVPELKIDQSWDSATKQVKITVRQTQKLSEQVRLFRLPLPVSFTVAGAKEPLRFTMGVSKDVEDFYFTLPAQPELVRIDPDFTVLAKINFSPPGPMLDKMLQSDLIGRLLAVRMLGQRDVEKLGKILREDSFHAVRSEAARALAKITTPEARAALIVASANQTNAHARRAVVEALAGLNTSESRDTLWKMAETEKNPLILASIIGTWGARPGEPVVSVALRNHLAGSSYQGTLELAAIKALRAQDDESAVPEILARLQQPHDIRGYEMGAAFDALAFLARRPTSAHRDAVRTFLTTHLTAPRQDWRIAAARALGTLRDPKALAALEPMLANESKPSGSFREAVSRSVQGIQSGIEGPVELKNLWDRMQQLQKKSEDQQKEIEALQKKAQAQSSPGAKKSAK
ncbi:MAG: M1 family aminopeptidase [Prosthecobacter sp.]